MTRNYFNTELEKEIGEKIEIGRENHLARSVRR